MLSKVHHKSDMYWDILILECQLWLLTMQNIQGEHFLRNKFTVHDDLPYE